MGDEPEAIATLHEELLSALFERGPQPTLLVDGERRIVDANDAFCAWTGRRRDALAGVDPADLMEPAARAAELARRALRAPPPEPIDCSVIAADGRALRAGLREIGLGGVPPRGGVVLFDPAGAQVRQWRRIAEHTSRLEKFFDMAPVGCVIHDDAGCIARVNRAYTEMSGYAEAELVGRAATQSPHPQERAAIESMLRHLDIAPDAIVRSVGPLLTRDGRALKVERVATWIAGLDGRRWWMTTVTDITQRSRAEDELGQLVQQQGALLRSITAGVMLVIGDRVIRCNPGLEALLGLSADRIIGQPVERILRADRSWASIREAGCDAVRRTVDYGCEIELGRADREPVSCALQLRCVDPSDPGAGQIVTLHDVTELNRQQSSLRKANAELSALVENTAVAVAYLDGHRVVRANGLMEHLLGFAAGALPGRTIGQLLARDDSAATELLEALADPTRRSCTVATKLRRVGAPPVPCLVHVGPVDKVRWPSASILVAIDMSGQEAALNALADSQERFVRFADAIEEAVFVIDVERRAALYANARLQTVLGVTPEAFYRHPDAVWRRVDPQDRARVDELLARAHLPGPHEADIGVVGAGSERRVVRLRLFSPRPGSTELYALAEDVTESRQSAQRRLDEAIQQRETLIREVHHRIKNNLQGVAGLMQQAAARQPEIAPQLEELVGQIQTIAQVHGLQVRDRGDMPVARLVGAVLDNVSRSFGCTIERPLDGDDALDDWLIPEREAVPLALVVNELGTNAAKHRDGAAPVTGALRVDGDHLVLSLRNPGRLPPRFTIAGLDAGPAGLSLVRALLPRRGAALSVTQAGDEVAAELRLGPPILRSAASDTMGT